MTWDKRTLEPQTEAERRECETVAGMRCRLQRYARDNALVKTVFDAAYYRGLSGEDTMTWLAFEALRRVEKLESTILEDAMRNPYPPIIFTNPENITQPTEENRG
jgi:hypothetical protein